MTTASDDRKRASPSTPNSTAHPPNIKRQRVDELSNSESTSRPSHRLPDLPLLYHTAISAHNSAHYHLQQAFVPKYVDIPRNEAIQRITPSGCASFTHDPRASTQALTFLVMALDLLRVGLSTPGISDKEHAAFGLEFATVAIKVLESVRSLKALSDADRASVGVVVDVKKLEGDVHSTVAKSLAAARSPHLKTYRHGLEIANAKLAFMKEKSALGKKIVKNALAETPSTDFVHRYNLILLTLNNLLELDSPDVFGLTEDLEEEAKTNGHIEVVQIAHLSRLAAMIRQRRWDSLLKTFKESASVLDPHKEDGTPCPPSSAYNEVFLFHFLILRALVQGRAGQDNEARAQLKRLYAAMDVAVGSKAMKDLRADGGVVQLRLSSPSGGDKQLLLVQSTPPNVLYALAYLATVVARRDVQGSVNNCRTLSYTRALRASEMLATVNDIWDCGFSPLQSLSNVTDTRTTLNSVRVEVMMEEAYALICRNAFQEVDDLLKDIAGRLREYRLYPTLGVQLTLLYGQYAHTLGLSEQAARYYEAAQVMLAPGSELRLIVDIGLLSVQGGLEDLERNHERASKVQLLADQCRSGSNRALHGVGLFLGSLADPERVSAKRQLSHAYEISRKGNPLLHCMIFAFTSSTHVYGDRERLLKLIDAGATLAHLLGGKDRADGVGQAVLGLWFAIKSRDYHRVSGDFDAMAKAEESVSRHKARITQIQRFSSGRFN